MVSVTLLQRARLAGLRLLADGDRLVIRGPRSQARLAKELLARKADVLEALPGFEAELLRAAADLGGGKQPASYRCPRCGERDFIRPRSGGTWRCARCHPPVLSFEQVKWWPAVGKTCDFGEALR